MNKLQKTSSAELFLQKYRILEGLLDKRYYEKKTSFPSVIMEYIRDEDSEPVRTDLDLLREIRNILSHNAGCDGSAVVEPSVEMLKRLDAIIEYVKQPRQVWQFGTSAERILYAQPDDVVLNVMRHMQKNGYSHVPVCVHNEVTGVFSLRSIFDFLALHDLSACSDNLRIRDLMEQIRLERETGERYMFISRNTSIVTVRHAFQHHAERNRRLSVVFVTENGNSHEKLICMLTPWDVLSDFPALKETRHGR